MIQRAWRKKMNNNEIQLIIEKRIKKWPEWKINMLSYEKHIHSISLKIVEKKEYEIDKHKSENEKVKLKK
jgi:hypothetical protein